MHLFLNSLDYLCGHSGSVADFPLHFIEHEEELFELFVRDFACTADVRVTPFCTGAQKVARLLRELNVTLAKPGEWKWKRSDRPAVLDRKDLRQRLKETVWVVDPTGILQGTSWPGVEDRIIVSCVPPVQEHLFGACLTVSARGLTVRGTHHRTRIIRQFHFREPAKAVRATLEAAVCPS